MTFAADNEPEQNSELDINDPAELKKHLANWKERWTIWFPAKSHARLYLDGPDKQWRFDDIETNDGTVSVPQSAIPQDTANENIAFYTPGEVGVWWIVNAQAEYASGLLLPGTQGNSNALCDKSLERKFVYLGIDIESDEKTVNGLAKWSDLGVPVVFDWGDDDVWVLIGVHTDEGTKRKKAYGYVFDRCDVVEVIKAGTIPVTMEEALKMEHDQKRQRQNQIVDWPPK